MNHTVEVETFGAEPRLALTLPHPTSADQLKEAVAKRLGLRPASLSLFGIMLGPLGRPQSVLCGTDPVPAGASLSLHRWTADTEGEARLVRRDGASLALLCGEARFRLDHRLLTPSPEEEAELEALSEPDFPTERQFLEAAHRLAGYDSFSAEGCQLEGVLENGDVRLDRETEVTCTLNPDGLSVWAGDGRRSLWRWVQVKQWRAVTQRMVQFEVCNKKGNAPILEWITMTTPQAHFLFQTANLLMDALKLRQDAAANPGPTGFNPLLPGKPYDPLREYVNKELFGTMKFSSIKGSQDQHRPS